MTKSHWYEKIALSDAKRMINDHPWRIVFCGGARTEKEGLFLMNSYAGAKTRSKDRLLKNAFVGDKMKKAIPLQSTILYR